MPELTMTAFKQPPPWNDEVHAEHRRTCPVCSTLGTKRTEHEFSFREFTPAGEIVELTIKQADEPLEDQDIAWVLQRAASLFPPNQSNG